MCIFIRGVMICLAPLVQSCSFRRWRHAVVAGCTLAPGRAMEFTAARLCHVNAPEVQIESRVNASVRSKSYYCVE